MAALRAAWFDGRSSRARMVDVHIAPAPGGPTLSLQPRDEPGAQPLLLRHGQVGWPELWSRRRAPPRLVVDLREHGSLEVEDVAGWHAALEQAGRRAPLAQRMQTRWSAFLLVALVALAGLAAFHAWGTPWAATQLARQVPLAWELALSQQALADLDAGLLKPSRLPAARQAQLRERFNALARQITPELHRYRAYAPPLSLQFRSGMPANAFALPGGTIVLTDAMVEAAARRQLPEDALLGVLAHEIGHVLHRHTTRMVVEQGVLNVGLGLALGDVSTLFSSGAALLTGLAYRRGHESEADCFALRLMQRAGLRTAPMGELLLAAEAQAGKDGAAPAQQAPAWAIVLSSHPDTAQRAQAFRQERPQACR